MSPEQAMGEKVDGRSDLFSVGIVLYQLLTGQAPFEATSLVTLAHRIAKQEPASIDKVRRDVPPALRRVIERCLKKQPEKRFQTGAELAAALTRVISDLDQDIGITGRPRIVPLRVKWTLTMAVIVAVTMAITAALVTQRQYAAMMRQVMDYGSSLASFLATENAAPTLAQEWVNVDVSVRDIMESQRFHEITVLDRQGVVRVSSDPDAVDQPYRPQPGAKEVTTREDGVVVRSYESAEGLSVLDFDAPITFKKGNQRIEIGRIHLGILERPLAAVARLSLLSMALLVLITTAAVSLATYLIADRYSKPLRLLQDSMAELGKGRFDYRIAEQRNDEFGQVYRSFDNMAQAVQKRLEPASESKDPPAQ
jgi:serine/threonine-protein kinase